MENVVTVKAILEHISILIGITSIIVANEFAIAFTIEMITENFKQTISLQRKTRTVL